MVSWCLSGFGGLRLSLILLYIKSFMVGTLQMFEMLCLLRSSEMDLGLGLVVRLRLDLEMMVRIGLELELRLAMRLCGTIGE